MIKIIKTTMVYSEGLDVRFNKVKEDHPYIDIEAFGRVLRHIRRELVENNTLLAYPQYQVQFDNYGNCHKYTFNMLEDLSLRIVTEKS